MKINRLFSYLFIAATVLGVGSCVKDPTPEEQQKQKKEQASRFWKVAGQLVNSADITDDYQDKTFEPTIGTPAAGDPLTRIVSTNSLRAAVERFNSLVDGSITAETGSYTFDDPNVGTLTWTKNADGKAWATVDVNIKQIPKLKTIVYQSPEQGNENGKFDGKSYYRFGDVVKRNYKGVEEYWICVRPCFGPEGKEKSHWVCVNTLPEDQCFEYESKNWEGHFYVPDDIGTNKEHMQGFAEFLYAITFPDEWERNVGMYSTEGFFGPDGLPFFHDFHVSNLNLHNKFFWQSVATGWKNADIFKKALNLDGGATELMESLKRDGVNLLYYDYSWWTWWDDELTLYQASYTNPTDDNKEELNLHHATYSEIVKNVNGIAKVDCRKMGSAKSDYNAFFGDNKIRWTIRHATGAELSETGDHGPQQPLSGVTQVYRYYYDRYNVTDLNGKEGPEETPDPSTAVQTQAQNAPADGSGTYMIGDVVKDEQGNRWFCIAGSPSSSMLPAEDHRATFITFDFNGVDISGDKIPGLPDDAEAAKIAAYWINTMENLTNNKDQLRYDRYPDKQRSILFDHVLEYANVDIHKVFTVMDSTFRFRSWHADHTRLDYENSQSKPYIFNIAVDDGSQGKQALLRVLFDDTEAGNKRAACLDSLGKKHQDMRIRYYKHYQTYDPSRIRDLTAGERSLEMTKYQLPWPMTGDRLYLQDVTSQALVDRHAHDDKWARLPLVKGENIPSEMRPKRTTAESSVKPRDYIGIYGRNGILPQEHMFNETVLFFRVMYVDDPGTSKTPPLVSKDGRKLTIVHLLDDKSAYTGVMQTCWAWSYQTYSKQEGLVTMDNEPYKLPEIQGAVY